MSIFSGWITSTGDEHTGTTITSPYKLEMKGYEDRRRPHTGIIYIEGGGEFPVFGEPEVHYPASTCVAFYMSGFNDQKVTLKLRSIIGYARHEDEPKENA